jgi:hypothetical protein
MHQKQRMIEVKSMYARKIKVFAFGKIEEIMEIPVTIWHKPSPDRSSLYTQQKLGTDYTLLDKLS